MTDLDILCPIRPHELDRRMRRGLEDVAERVAGAAVIYGLGRDLLLLVYMAGLSHGSEAEARRMRADDAAKDGA
jgi:hypothetical protein